MSLAILFFMLTIRELTGNPTLFGTFTFNNLTGIEGVICGLSAVYLAFAEVLNEAHKKPCYPSTLQANNSTPFSILPQ
jgi:succinate-acetate transporter protein